MTISDDAERLRSIASSDRLPIPLVRQAIENLVDVNAEVAQILGTTSQRGQGIIGLSQQAAEVLGNALAALQGLESAIHDAADYFSQG